MSYARHQMPQIGSNGDGLWWAQAFGGHGVAPTCAAGELLAAALAEGDEGWKQFSDYGLANTYRPLGFLAAQTSYWWHECNDWFKTRLEG
jgi:gamma-glutamylputrescine oxidase